MEYLYVYLEHWRQTQRSETLRKSHIGGSNDGADFPESAMCNKHLSQLTSN